jgi:uncharacterized membrane protein YfcA
MDHIVLAPILGMFIGILMGLTGAGGGILSVPILVFAFHMPTRKRVQLLLQQLHSLLAWELRLD